MKKKAVFLLSPEAFRKIYGERQMAAIRELVEIAGPLPAAGGLAPGADVLREAAIAFGGWGSPVLDQALLDRMPALEAFFYGAGSIRGIVTSAFWSRGIPLTSSYAANAVPVAEFAEAQIILALKRAWPLAAACREQQRNAREQVAGAYGTTVGLVGLGMIGKLTARRLQTHEARVLAYDPFVTQAQADALNLGVTMTSLATLFATSEAVSLHAPNIPATRGMITRDLLASMKPYATLINTARGALIDEPALLEVLAARPDLTALLDVTDPEPPAPGSPLITLPNVFLTPHIAGSMAGECTRMGQIAVDECRRFLNGEPLQWAITRAMSENMA
jgi:phosphoglycerate dehydrogenase-like enzyme